MGLSTHVLDTMHGTPAAGMQVTLYEVKDGNATQVKRFRLNDDGRNPDGLLFDWLCDEGSLTRRLMAAGQDDFRVEVLLQEHQPARPDEAAALGLDAGQPLWVREVLLHTAGAPRVFARTVADLQAFNAAGVHLENLGSRSLGQLLFSDPRIQREPIEISLYPAAWLPALRRTEGCWARRSRFRSDRLQLLVCVVFLPGWPRPA